MLAEGDPGSGWSIPIPVSSLLSTHCHVGPLRSQPSETPGSVAVAVNEAVAEVPTATGSGDAESAVAATDCAIAGWIPANRVAARTKGGSRKKRTPDGMGSRIGRLRYGTPKI
jgi:hypothetical protein